MCIVPYGMPDTCSEIDVTMLIREHFEIKETAVTIISDTEYLKEAKDAIFEAREIIEHKIAEDPFFQTTYDPYPVQKNDHELIRMMCNASVLADVGPMAAVAGAVASYAVERMKEKGCKHAIVDNGGDIALLADRDVTIGLFTGDDELKDIALNVRPADRIRGICSSSGKIGPSVSFGQSNISTVFSNDVILADAAATRLGNLVKDHDLEEALEIIGNIPGIDGCLVYHNGKLAMFGDVPELVQHKVQEDRITGIRLS
jgi:Uncharacterized conserved protein